MYVHRMYIYTVYIYVLESFSQCYNFRFVSPQRKPFGKSVLQKLAPRSSNKDAYPANNELHSDRGTMKSRLLEDPEMMACERITTYYNWV